MNENDAERGRAAAIEWRDRRHAWRNATMTDGAGISVVTPCLDAEPFICDCLSSVILQSDSSDEHLVVDGGSTDRTVDLVQRYPHARVVALRGASQSEALNWGLRNARNRVTCWLNADDVLMDGAFGTVRREIPGTDGPGEFLFGNFLELDRAGHFIRPHLVPPLFWHVVRNFAMYLPTSGSFIVRGKNELPLIDGQLHVLMDRDFLLRLHAAGFRVRRLDGWLSGFRIHDAQKSGRGRNLEMRRAERRHVNLRHGGVWYRERRLLRWNRGLAALGRVYLVCAYRSMNQSLAHRWVGWSMPERRRALDWLDRIRADATQRAGQPRTTS